MSVNSLAIVLCYSISHCGAEEKPVVSSVLAGVIPAPEVGGGAAGRDMLSLHWMAILAPAPSALVKTGRDSSQVPDSPIRVGERRQSVTLLLACICYSNVQVVARVA